MPPEDNPADDVPATREEWEAAVMNSPKVEITLTTPAVTFDLLAAELERLQAVYGFTTHIRRL